MAYTIFYIYVTHWTSQTPSLISFNDSASSRARRERGQVGWGVREGERLKENSHKHSSSPFIWGATHFKVRCRTVFVRTRAKSNQPRYLLMLFFIFKITHCIHIQISLKFIHQTPVFQQIGSYSAPKTPVCGDTDTDFCNVVKQSVRSQVDSETCPLWSFSLHGSPDTRLSRLQIHGPWPTTSKPNCLWGRIQNNLKWMKWQDRHYYW